MTRHESETKRYLGDGLYAYHDGFMFWLRAENGISVQHEVALEPEVLESFFRYVERICNVTIKVTKNTDQKEQDENGN